MAQLFRMGGRNHGGEGGGGGGKRVGAGKGRRPRTREEREKGPLSFPFWRLPRSLSFTVTCSRKHYTIVLLFSIALRGLGSGSACHLRTLSLKKLGLHFGPPAYQMASGTPLQQGQLWNKKKKKTTTTRTTTTTTTTTKTTTKSSIVTLAWR